MTLKTIKTYNGLLHDRECMQVSENVFRLPLQPNKNGPYQIDIMFSMSI